MKVLVCIKHVPDTETKIRVAPDGRSLDESGVKWILSPYDEFALEEAIRLREAGVASEVIVVSLGAPGCRDSLRQALAIGADRAILTDEVAFGSADALTRARALAAIAKRESAELALVGKYGVGTDEWLTGPMLAELLNWPHVSGVSKLDLAADGQFTARRAIEGAIEVLEGRLPAVLSCDKGLNQPRYASLKGIMAAKKKPMDVLSLADLGLDPSELQSPRLVRVALELPSPRRSGRILGGTAAEAAADLARLLREEAKVI